MKSIYILISIYNDWKSLKLLLKKINEAVEKMNSCKFNCLILNDASTIPMPEIKKPNNIINSTTFEHPIYSMDTLIAQKDVMNIQGLNNTYYCGAYLGYGFHEDGIQSAAYIAKLLGCNLSWNREKNFYNRLAIKN